MNDLPKHPLLTKPLWTNTITIIGMMVGGIALLLLITFGLFSVVTPAANPYVDIVGYLILPGILAVGIFLMLVGILIRSIRRRRLDPTRRLRILPRPDFTDPLQIKAAKYIAIALFALLPITAVTGYHGYHFTDSTDFCAQACHTVMQPEAVAYERSSHARVSCAECHIGSGASWFVKSKVSGLRQVLATARESYSRPIPPAITELRPARETCEECHWPQKFFGSQLREFPHYASDETNSQRSVAMLVKTGGGDEFLGTASGIHRHMALAGRIEYIATDEKLQEIPWVRWTDDSGTVHIYRSDGKPASDPVPEGELRQIDCMDCHNRPAHEFRAPQESVDRAIANGRIDRTLPYIKREAVATLLPPYLEEHEALARIGDQISRFYRDQHPDLWESRRASIYQAIDTTREIYRSNVFSYMKVDWTTYPDNIGHLYSAGCFRCHDNRHVSQHGETISSTCEGCHTFLLAGSSDEEQVFGGDQVSYHTGDFKHPMELEGVHESVLCHQCHSGGASPSQESCEGCHTSESGLITASLAELGPFGVEPDLMDGIVGCEDCHTVSEPHSRQIAAASCEMCHDESYLALHLENVAELAALRQAVLDRIEQDPDPGWSERARSLVVLLDDAGTHHNAEASRTVLQTLLDSP